MPHHIPMTASDRQDGTVRRRLTVTMCGDRRGMSPLHRISLFGYDDAGRAALEGIGLSVRPARKGSLGWRFETATKDMAVIAETVERIRSVLDVNVRYVARLAKEQRRGSRQLVAVHDRVLSAAGHGDGRRGRRVRRRRRRRVGLDRRAGLRPRRRADAQLRRQRHRDAQLDLQVPRGGLPELDRSSRTRSRKRRRSCSTRTTGRRSASSTPRTR